MFQFCSALRRLPKESCRSSQKGPNTGNKGAEFPWMLPAFNEGREWMQRKGPQKSTSCDRLHRGRVGYNNVLRRRGGEKEKESMRSFVNFVVVEICTLGWCGHIIVGLVVCVGKCTRDTQKHHLPKLSCVFIYIYIYIFYYLLEFNLNYSPPLLPFLRLYPISYSAPFCCHSLPFQSGGSYSLLCLYSCLWYGPFSFIQFLSHLGCSLVRSPSVSYFRVS